MRSIQSMRDSDYCCLLAPRPGRGNRKTTH